MPSRQINDLSRIENRKKLRWWPDLWRQRFEARDVPGEVLVDGRAGGLADLEPDGLGHPLGLVGEGYGVAVGSAFLPSDHSLLIFGLKPVVFGVSGPVTNSILFCHGSTI